MQGPSGHGRSFVLGHRPRRRCGRSPRSGGPGARIACVGEAFDAPLAIDADAKGLESRDLNDEPARFLPSSAVAGRGLPVRRPPRRADRARCRLHRRGASLRDVRGPARHDAVHGRACRGSDRARTGGAFVRRIARVGALRERERPRPVTRFPVPTSAAVDPRRRRSSFRSATARRSSSRLDRWAPRSRVFVSARLLRCSSRTMEARLDALGRAVEQRGSLAASGSGSKGASSLVRRGRTELPRLLERERERSVEARASMRGACSASLGFAS